MTRNYYGISDLGLTEINQNFQCAMLNTHGIPSLNIQLKTCQSDSPSKGSNQLDVLILWQNGKKPVHI